VKKKLSESGKAYFSSAAAKARQSASKKEYFSTQAGKDHIASMVKARLAKMKERANNNGDG